MFYKGSECEQHYRRQKLGFSEKRFQKLVVIKRRVKKVWYLNQGFYDDTTFSDTN